MMDTMESIATLLCCQNQMNDYPIDNKKRPEPGRFLFCGIDQVFPGLHLKRLIGAKIIGSA